MITIYGYRKDEGTSTAVFSGFGVRHRGGRTAARPARNRRMSGWIDQYYVVGSQVISESSPCQNSREQSRSSTNPFLRYRRRNRENAKQFQNRMSIRQTFTIPQQTQEAAAAASATEHHTFDASNVSTATVGLAPGESAAKAEPGTYAYTGMHDHGAFQAPKEGGPIALLIGCANEAQKASDKFLTEIIEREKKATATSTSTGAAGDGGKKRSSDGTKKTTDS